MSLISRRSFSSLAAAAAVSGVFSLRMSRAARRGPRLVVVGGGFGGASASRYARLSFPDIDVTLIEPRTSFITCPYGNLVLAGTKTVNNITHSYDGLKGLGVNVVHDWVDAIDSTAKDAAS